MRARQRAVVEERDQIREDCTGPVMTVFARCGASKQARTQATTRRISPTNKRCSNGFLCVKYTQRMLQLNVLTVVSTAIFAYKRPAQYPLQHTPAPVNESECWACYHTRTHAHSRLCRRFVFSLRVVEPAWPGLAWHGLASAGNAKTAVLCFCRVCAWLQAATALPGAAPAADAACSSNPTNFHSSHYLAAPLLLLIC